MAILNNNPLVGASGNQGGYNINNSLRFRRSASASLTRTPSSATNRKTWTWSGWVKRGLLSSTTLFDIYYANNSTALFDRMYFHNSNGTFELNGENGVSVVYNLVTTQVFRDPSAWYHIVVAFDTTQATASNRIKIYVNGNQVTAFSTSTYPSLNFDTQVNNNVTQYIGTGGGGASDQLFDGYMAEVNFIDGSAKTPSDFGETDTTTGVWKPKAYTGTYGTNGFYLKFSDIATTSGSNAGLGKDFSGNTNYWTTNNISVTSGTTYDAMTDSPTNTSATVANYCTLNPLNASMSPTSGNLNLEPSGTSGNYIAASTLGVSTGKWYYEIVATTYTGSGTAGEFGFRLSSASAQTIGTAVGDASGFAFIMSLSSTWLSQKYGTTAVSLTGLTSATTGTIGMIAVDFDAGYAWVGKDGTWYNSGNPATGANPTITGITAGNYVATIAAYRDGSRNYSFAANFGQRPFSYTPPTGFVALNTYNLPTPTILQGNKYMDATLYTGNGTGQTITNAGSFRPDFLWIKVRSNTYDHTLADSVRGVSAFLASNTTAAEGTNSELTSFNSNGFTLGATGSMARNVSGQTYVGWQWQAGQGSTSSNTSGTITSTVSVNTTAGFSIVTYTGNGTAGATVGHGLGVAPKMFIVKNRVQGTYGNWNVWHTALSGSQYLTLNATDAAGTNNNRWNGTVPTSTVFSLGADTFGNTNKSGDTYVAYCWAEIAGFSKFGSYTGNGSADGPMIYCNFTPKFILIKRTDTSGTSWVMYDSARATYNVVDKLLLSDSSGAEVTATSLDFLSNGFKLRSTDGSRNASGGTYIYACFASNPFRNSNAY